MRGAPVVICGDHLDHADLMRVIRDHHEARGVPHLAASVQIADAAGVGLLLRDVEVTASRMRDQGAPVDFGGLTPFELSARFDEIAEAAKMLAAYTDEPRPMNRKQRRAAQRRRP